MSDENRTESRKEPPCWQKPDPDKNCGVQRMKWLFGRFNRKQQHFSLLYFLLVLGVLWLLNAFLQTREIVSIIEFSDFKAKIASGEIRRVQMSRDEYTGFTLTREQLAQNQKKEKFFSRLNDSIKVYKAVPVEDASFVPLLDSLKVEYYAKIEKQNPFLTFLLSWILPMIFMIFIWRLLFRRMGNNSAMGVMNFGNNRSQLVAEGDIKVRFDDVAGIDEAKEELSEVVDFLKKPEKYTTIGGKIPKGVLLVGPPGTGKTLCARAVAGEAGVPFFKMSGADFVEMFVGVGAARVRDLFRQAREKSPCIIFIDELDAIGKARGSMAVGGHDEREQTLNQLLVEMDGFDSRSGVIILAATNRPEILDPALLRPGRFDRQILVDKPDLKGREEILKRHVKDIKLDASVDLHDIAARTPGFAGADLENLANEAALLAVRNNRDRVLQQDFENAIEKLIAGLEKKNRIMNPKEREIVAHHETGHALIAAFTPGADPVKKITIVPRGLGALGYTMQVPIEDRFLMSERELLGKIDVLLGGRAAEDIIFNEISTGASNDIVRATDIARKMITDYGMSDKFRNMALQSHAGPNFLGTAPGAGQQREYSEQTQQYIDDTVASVIDDRYTHVKEILGAKKDILLKVAKKLLEKETVGETEFLELIGK
jgi:cell division protease FtsH